jgi:hypothetical protein
MLGFIKGCHDKLELAHIQLMKVVKSTKCWVDHGSIEIGFQVGDLVLLKLDTVQFKPQVHISDALLRRFKGPFKLLKKFGNVAYKSELLKHTSSPFTFPCQSVGVL